MKNSISTITKYILVYYILFLQQSFCSPILGEPDIYFEEDFGGLLIKAANKNGITFYKRNINGFMCTCDDFLTKENTVRTQNLLHTNYEKSLLDILRNEMIKTDNEKRSILHFGYSNNYIMINPDKELIIKFQKKIIKIMIKHNKNKELKSLNMETLILEVKKELLTQTKIIIAIASTIFCLICISVGVIIFVKKRKNQKKNILKSRDLKL